MEIILHLPPEIPAKSLDDVLKEFTLQFTRLQIFYDKPWYDQYLKWIKEPLEELVRRNIFKKSKIYVQKEGEASKVEAILYKVGDLGIVFVGYAVRPPYFLVNLKENFIPYLPSQLFGKEEDIKKRYKIFEPYLENFLKEICVSYKCQIGDILNYISGELFYKKEDIIISSPPPTEQIFSPLTLYA